MLTDQEIVELLFARSEKALEALSSKYGAGLHHLTMNILNREEDAEESVNDAYLVAWNAIPPKRPNPLGAYLFRIARNIAITKYHSIRAQKRGGSYDLALDELEECLASENMVEDRITTAELTEAINHFLNTLERRDRYLFVRRYWYGDPVDTLAKLTHQKPNTVSVRLIRLREKLRKQLEKEGLLE